MLRILITGFGPFPGSPSNPSMRLARSVGAIKSPRFEGVERIVRLLPTTWAMLDDVSGMLSDLQPDIVLMFGVAGRRRKVTPELRAVNHQSMLRPDANRGFSGARAREVNASHQLKTRLNAERLRVAIQAVHVPSQVSRDAGDYICNALSWHVIRSGIPAIFVHVPRPRRKRPKGQEKRPRPMMRDLERAAEVALSFVIKEARALSADR